MKFLILIATVALFAGAQALTDAQKAKIQENSKLCIGETGANLELVKKFKGGDFNFEDDKTKSFVFCLMKKSELMDDAGKFRKEVALAKVDESIRDAVSKAIDSCLDKVGPTPAETAWNYAKCYHLVRPGHDFI